MEQRGNLKNYRLLNFIGRDGKKAVVGNTWDESKLIKEDDVITVDLAAKLDYLYLHVVIDKEEGIKEVFNLVEAMRKQLKKEVTGTSSLYVSGHSGEGDSPILHFYTGTGHDDIHDNNFDVNASIGHRVEYITVRAHLHSDRAFKLLLEFLKNSEPCLT